MFKKLDKMLERYEKLNRLVGDPAVIAKMDEWKAYTKELADMQETVEKYTEYKKSRRGIGVVERIPAVRDGQGNERPYRTGNRGTERENGKDFRRTKDIALTKRPRRR